MLTGWAIRKKAFPYFLIAPSLIAIFAVILFPLIRGVSFAFTNKFLIASDYNFVGLANFKKLLHDPVFWLSFKNSIIWTALGVVSQLLFGFWIAYLLNLGLKGEKIFRGLFLIPWSVSTIISCMIWRWLYAPSYGFINYYLSLIGFEEKVYFLANPKVALYSIILVLVWRGFPFVMLTFLAGLQSIDKELYEAATIDGASAWQQLRFITFPILKPIITIITILETMWVFNTIDFVWIISKGGPANRTQLLCTYTYHNAFFSFRVGYGSAIGFVILATLIIISLIYIKTRKK
jgi:multiple sugar transport system permease protein